MDDTKILLQSYEPTINFSLIPRVITRSYMKHIGTNAYAVYCYYCSMVNKELGYAFPSLKQTAGSTGLGVRTIQRCNAILQEFHLIRQESGTGTMHTKYYILNASRDMLRVILKESSDHEKVF